MGHKGQLARSQNMTAPDANGNYDLGKNFCYHKVVDDDDVVDYTGANEAVILQHFLTPLPPIFAGLPSRKMVTGIACGGHHMLVTARGPGESKSKLYSCGLNNYGQLGLGDLNDATYKICADRHELTLVSVCTSVIYVEAVEALVLTYMLFLYLFYEYRSKHLNTNTLSRLPRVSIFLWP
jgi:NADH:ubiquinone oxidoreductase subunit 3 (subunit A)